MNGTQFTGRRFAAYVRVSSERGRSDDAESYHTIEVQRAKCEALAQTHGLEIVEWYIDEDWSGERDDRPDYQRMMADFEAGALDGVISMKMDRFGRKMTTIIADVDRLQQAGHRVIFGYPNVDTGDEFTGPLFLAIFAALAEIQRRQIAANWSDVVQRRITSLAPLAVPYGYVRRGVNDEGHHSATLVPDDEYPVPGQPSAASVVRRIFDMRRQGLGWSAIADHLNEGGVWTPTQLKAHRGELGKRKPAATWGHSTVYNIATSKAHTGTFEFSPKDGPKIIHENAWPALVGLPVWEDAQPEAEATRNGSNGDALLKGLVRCANCGRTMRPGSSAGQLTYVCKGSRAGCDKPATVVRPYLDPWVDAQVREVIASQPQALEAARNDEARERVASELEELRAQRRAFMAGYGSMLQSEDADDRADAQAIRDRHDAAISVKRRELAQLDGQASQHERRTTTVEKYDALSPDQRRREIALLVDAVFVGRAVGWRRPVEERAAIAWSGQAPRHLLSGTGRSVPNRVIDLDAIRRGERLAD